MDLMEAIRERHSVRQYTDQPIPEEVKKALLDEIEACNREGNLNIQLSTDEPGAFSCRMAHYGHFENVRNYINMIGPKGNDLEERIGYYGERLVIKAQQLGLSSCWVGMSYSKSKSDAVVQRGEKYNSVIALGYAAKPGHAHRSKPIEKVAKLDNTPDWFKAGVESALLAPTAVNQQKFYFEYLGENRVKARTSLLGFFLKVDLGIAKYHFEIGADRTIEWH